MTTYEDLLVKLARKGLAQKFAEFAGGTLPVHVLQQNSLCELFDELPSPSAIAFSDVAFTFTYRSKRPDLTLSAKAVVTHTYARQMLADCGFSDTFGFTAAVNSPARKLDPTKALIEVSPDLIGGRDSRSGALPEECEPILSALALDDAL